MGATEALARFIAETQYDDLPAEVVAAAKIGIFDGVANLLAGSTQPVAQLVSAYTLELGGTPVSSVIGRGFKTDPLNAAFANGVSGHCRDFEPQGQPSSHGTSSILPGPLALAEARRSRFPHQALSGADRHAKTDGESLSFTPVRSKADFLCRDRVFSMMVAVSAFTMERAGCERPTNQRPARLSRL
jgi:MmgE/PrpD N-terminal domain